MPEHELPRRRIEEKLDRVRALRAVTGLPEEIILGGEIWKLYPLYPPEILELYAWRAKHPVPMPQGGLSIQELDQMSRLDLDRLEESNISASMLAELTKYSEQITRWNLEHAYQVAWLSLRRNCLSEQEYEQALLAIGTWPLSPSEVELVLPIEQALEVAERIFRLNGAFAHRPGFHVSFSHAGNRDGGRLENPVLSGSDQTAPLTSAIPSDDTITASDPAGKME